MTKEKLKLTFDNKSESLMDLLKKEPPRLFFFLPQQKLLKLQNYYIERKFLSNNQNKCTTKTTYALLMRGLGDLQL